jgi:hypothetical protein
LLPGRGGGQLTSGELGGRGSVSGRMAVCDSALGSVAVRVWQCGSECTAVRQFVAVRAAV